MSEENALRHLEIARAEIDNAIDELTEGTPSPPTDTRMPFGYFALQPGAHDPPDNMGPPTGSRLISVAELSHPNVVGLTIRMRPGWDYVPFAEQCVNTCEQANRLFTLLMIAGGSQTPWDPAHKQIYINAADKLSDAFDGHPLLAGVHVTGGSNPGTSEELHWKKPMPRQAVALNKELIEVWHNAFPDYIKLLAIGGGAPDEMREIITHGGVVCGEDRFLVKHNSMKANTEVNATHNQIVKQAAADGYLAGFEMVCGTNDYVRFGSKNPMDGVNKGKQVLAPYSPQKAYWAMYPEDLDALQPL